MNFLRLAFIGLFLKFVVVILQKNRMLFDDFIANSKSVFASFPNERVWLQGGFLPNRQLQKPEAGYCVVMRFDEKTTELIVAFMEKVRAILPSKEFPYNHWCIW